MRPTVSVSLITRNQQTAIEQAVESVLAQRTDFPIELVIGEDASTDGTREILLRYARRHPDRIQLLLHDTRRGLLGNFVATFARCRGEYVALLDGDDYWTDERKLARQVRFLDGQPDCAICFHDVAMLAPEGHLYDQTYTGARHPPFSGIDDLIENNFIATSSAMLRRDLVPQLPSWFADCQWEDWPLFLLYAERGRIGYLAEVMAVYRCHAQGLWSSLPPAEKIRAVIRFLDSMRNRLDPRYGPRILQCIQTYRERLGLLESNDTRPVTRPRS